MICKRGSGNAFYLVWFCLHSRWIQEDVAQYIAFIKQTKINMIYIYSKAPSKRRKVIREEVLSWYADCQPKRTPVPYLADSVSLIWPCCPQRVAICMVFRLTEREEKKKKNGGMLC